MATLRGRVAIVTGGGRGIGAATATALAQLGAYVAVVARSREQVGEVAARLASYGTKSLAVAADVSDQPAITDAIGKISASLGPIDVLINNAGAVGPLGPTMQIEPAAWRQALGVNLMGAFWCIKAVLPTMITRGWGRIVNVSTAATTGTAMLHANAYSVSKTGLEMLTVNLAAELEGTGVTVNAVRPGRTDTAMQAQIRAGDPEVIGAALVARAQAVYANRQLLPPERPASLIIRLLEQDTTGEIVDMNEPRGRALLNGTNKSESVG